MTYEDTNGDRMRWDETLRQWVPITGSLSPAELADQMQPVLASRFVPQDITQVGNTGVLEPFTITFAPAGAPTFDIKAGGYPNSGAQAGTYNQAVHFGFNAGRHGEGAVVENAPAIIMGFESNYFDDGGDNFRGVEWYVEYYSPDGTTQQMLRPFYTRIRSDGNTDRGAVILCNIGEPTAAGQFTVRSGPEGVGTTNLFTVAPTTITLNATTTMTAGTFTVQPASGAGIVFVNTPASTTASFQAAIGGATALNLIAQNAGRVQLYTGTGGLHIDMTGVSGGGALNTTYLRSALRAEGGFGVFNASTVTTKPTVTGSRESNAALASLLTALASYGLITDSSS